ncbi:MAG: hypothetical protein DHS20C03_24860 [Minwuia thermotolerans]|nr:MAG: hypothetical protein DHS20C03_24860 [Minwuia thermotolerans]
MLRILAGALMAGLLAGCADTGTLSGDAPEPARLPDAISGTTGSPSVAPPPAVAGAPQRPALAFIGASRRDLVAWLGQPDLELSEGQGSLLQFRRGQCVALAMVGAGDAVEAIEVSGVVSRVDQDCADRQLAKVSLQ